MRITPLDIRKQEFHKVMRGLDPEEVYAFLSTVGDEYETLLNDNKALRDRVLELDDKVQEYRSMEKTLRDTLLTAERVTVEAKDNARREANLIIKEAQIEAEKALRDIKNESMRLHQEVQQLRREREGYLARMKMVAESHLKFLETADTDFAREDDFLKKQQTRDGRSESRSGRERSATDAGLFSRDTLVRDERPVRPKGTGTPAPSPAEPEKAKPVPAQPDHATETVEPSTPEKNAAPHETILEKGIIDAHTTPPPVSNPVPRPVPEPDGATTLSDISDILERMAEGQKEILSASASDEPAGPRFAPIPQSRAVGPPPRKAEDAPLGKSGRPAEHSPKVPVGRAWDYVTGASSGSPKPSDRAAAIEEAAGDDTEKPDNEGSKI